MVRKTKVKTHMRKTKKGSVCVVNQHMRTLPDVNQGNLVNYIMDYEGGNMSRAEYLALFSYIVKNKLYMSLQGMYGREAQRLIDAGLLLPNGDVNWDKIEAEDQDLSVMIYDE